MSSILLKYVKIVNNSNADFTFKDKIVLLTIYLIFKAKILDKHLKIQTFLSKIVQNKLL